MDNNSNKIRKNLSPKIKWTLLGKFRPFYRIRYFFGNKWEIFRQRCQCFKRGFAWNDVWNMNFWFVSTIKSMLEHLLKNHQSHPCDISNDEWNNILQEMIDCLKFMDEDVVLSNTYAENEYSADYWEKVENLMEENKNRFFELFSKWFF